MTENENKPLEHAVVVGSGMSGLMAARVLSDKFKKVTILERDILPAKPGVRKTVPQGNHVHVILGGGTDVLENYFPGILSQMEEAGGSLIDTTRDFSWYHHGAWRARHTSGVNMLLSYRPFMDWHTRRNLESGCPNVVMREKVLVEEYLTSPDKSKVTGVRITGPRKKSEEIYADLVVDASGRSSKTPEMLEAIGYQRPPESSVGIDLAYTTRIYKCPKKVAENWKLLILYPHFPDTWRAGFISHIEENKWIVSLNGYFGDHAPLDDKGFLEFARSLPTPDIYNRIKDLKPIGDTKIFKIPKIRRRYYEKLARFPDGLVVIGDANCVYNPIFGQGITAASAYTEALRTGLAKQLKKTPGDLSGFPKVFQSSLPAALNLPWFLTNVIDLAYPQATGKRPPGMSLIKWIVARMLEANSRNPRLHQKFMEVLHLHKGLSNLLHPVFILSVLGHGIKSLFVPLDKRANTKEMPPTMDLKLTMK